MFLCTECRTKYTVSTDVVKQKEGISSLARDLLPLLLVRCFQLLALTGTLRSLMNLWNDPRIPQGQPPCMTPSWMPPFSQ